MKKKSLFCVLLSILLCFTTFFLNTSQVFAVNEKLYLGGMTAGFSVQTCGANIVGLCDVVTKNGVESPSKDIDLQVGDIIKSIDGEQTNSACDVEKNIKGKKKVLLEIERDGQIILKNMTLAKDVSGCEKLGVFIKDDISGIGTITFIKGNRFASLGHPIVENDGKLLDILGGKLYK